jgi:hypothetical protein
MRNKLAELRYELCDVFRILKDNLSNIDPSLDDLKKISLLMNNIMDILEKYNNYNNIDHVKSLIMYELLTLRKN